MQIRPLKAPDLAALAEIDGTIESTRYLHVEKSGEAMEVGWKIQDRPLREKWIDANRMDHTALCGFHLATQVPEWPALLAEHDGQIAAAAHAMVNVDVLQLLELRVDYKHRREGLASAMLFEMIQMARQRKLRGVRAEAKTNNFPANQLLHKLGFELAGLDLARTSNHDLVKESVTLLWYLSLD
jgi:ribosomal protein S18 acetylase RimI-like enzyme